MDTFMDSFVFDQSTAKESDSRIWTAFCLCVLWTETSGQATWWLLKWTLGKGAGAVHWAGMLWGFTQLSRLILKWKLWKKTDLFFFFFLKERYVLFILPSPPPNPQTNTFVCEYKEGLFFLLNCSYGIVLIFVRVIFHNLEPWNKTA